MSLRFLSVSAVLATMLLAAGCTSVAHTNPLTMQSMVSLKAAGDKPHWAADIEDNRLFFSTDEFSRSVAQLTARSNYASGISYSGKWQGQDLVFNVVEQECEDSRGRSYAYTAQATLNEQVFSGCAVL